MDASDMFDLYVVTDSSLSNGLSDAEIARLAYEGGADVVQLRMKNVDAREMMDQALLISDLAQKMRRFFIVNDRVDVAMASGADGVHLGQSDLPIDHARRIMGDDAIIGASVHSVDEAIKAVEDGADYLGVGAIFSTKTKLDAIQGLGLGVLFEIRQAVDVPVVAIGGINRGNIQDVIRAGADSAAVVSAVVSQPSPKDAAHELRDLILKVRPHVRKRVLLLWSINYYIMREHSKHHASAEQHSARFFGPYDRERGRSGRRPAADRCL